MKLHKKAHPKNKEKTKTNKENKNNNTFFKNPQTKK